MPRLARFGPFELDLETGELRSQLTNILRFYMTANICSPCTANRPSLGVETWLIDATRYRCVVALAR